MNPTAAHTDDVEARVQQIGRQLLAGARPKQHWWSRFTDEDALLNTLMSSDAMRTAALRFVDVLPALRDDRELVRHLDEYFGDQDLPLPIAGLAQWGLRQARGDVAASLLAPVVRSLAGRMARRFIAGDRVETAQVALHRLHRNGMGFTLDLLGEVVVSEAEADTYQQHYLRLLGELDPIVRGWEDRPLLDHLSGRRAPRLNLSLKVSALCPYLDPVAPDSAVARIKERLRPILREARRRGAFITLDMEHYDTKAITLRVFRDVLDEDEFRDWPDAGIAMQAYLRDTPADIEQMIDWARRRGAGAPVMVRLVRGAYWDYETVIARQHHWNVPVWTQKWETDRCYEQCLSMLLGAYPHVDTAVATHNVRSIALAIALAEQQGLAPSQYELQMLYGMAMELKGRLVEMGQRLRIYVPFGELIPGMAYLVRRLLENTASQSFLKMGFVENQPVEELLAAPHPPKPDPNPRTQTGLKGVPAEPEHRFTAPAERDRFAAAMAQVREQFGRRYPLIIAGREHDTTEHITSRDPAQPDRIIGVCASGGATEADRAVHAAAEAFPGWRGVLVKKRTDLLRRAAALLRERRDTIAAWEVYEAGKPWREADGDVCEAIDYLEYYACQAERLMRGYNLDVPGETNRYFYEPRGVTAVIAPWNFPLAIPLGMAIGAIATGNTVVLKPAPQTPVIAAKFVELMHEAGLPPGVLNFLPGGDEAGKALVAHPGVHAIAFTGSMAAGTSIYATAAKIAPGQDHLKHVLAELGGKNAIIIDSDADVDDAVLGVVRSSFGYAGQKCSAASRIIVVGNLYEAFLKRLVEATAGLNIGPAEEPSTDVPPVIDDESRQRILAAIEEAKPYATLRLHTDCSDREGFYVGPTIFADVPPDSRLAQEEVFGPVLAVMRAATFEQAVAIANNTRFALTGGVYSRSPAHLDLARRNFRVGNLYLNRKVTGALVGRQPFGGMKMSGTNAKAGGPDYLLHFVTGRTVTENTIRRGFAPESDEAFPI